MINVLENVTLNVPYEIKRYIETETVFQETEELEKVGIIMEGSVFIHTVTLGGFEFEISRMGKGQMFGNALLYKKRRELPGSITVEKGSCVLFISMEDFRRLLFTNGAFLNNYLAYESERNRYLQYRVKLLGQPSLRDKILFFLKEEMKKSGTDTVFLNMTKEDLSRLLSTNRPSLSRELSRMAADGLIEYDRYKIRCLK